MRTLTCSTQRAKRVDWLTNVPPRATLRAVLPLDGVRVLEIGGDVPAAFATRWLAGYGADVVRSGGP